MTRLLALAVVRRGWNGCGDAALRVDAAGAVAAHLEREHARDVGGERERLQVEHQLDVLAERVGHADRRAGQLARLAAGVVRLDALDAALDLADRRRGTDPAGARSAGAELPLAMRATSRRDPVEDAAIGRGGCAARCAGVAPTPNS